MVRRVSLSNSVEPFLFLWWKDILLRNQISKSAVLKGIGIRIKNFVSGLLDII